MKIQNITILDISTSADVICCINKINENYFSFFLFPSTYTGGVAKKKNIYIIILILGFHTNWTQL